MPEIFSTARATWSRQRAITAGQQSGQFPLQAFAEAGEERLVARRAHPMTPSASMPNRRRVSGSGEESEGDRETWSHVYLSREGGRERGAASSARGKRGHKLATTTDATKPSRMPSSRC